MNITEKFEVWTDHENLKYFREHHKLNGWQARWYLKLQDYDFELHHISEKTNTKADILLRKDHVDIQDDNKDIQILKEELWMKRTTAEVMILQRNKMVKETNLLEEIVQELKKDNGQLWKDDGIVYVDRQIYIPNNRKIQE